MPTPCRHFAFLEGGPALANCGFTEEGAFTPDNSSCILLLELYRLCGTGSMAAYPIIEGLDDHELGVIPIALTEVAGHYAVLHAQRNGSKLLAFLILDDNETRTGTEEEAKQIINGATGKKFEPAVVL